MEICIGGLLLALSRPYGLLRALQIFRGKSRVLGQAGEHARADFIAVVEGKHDIRPAGSRQGFVRSGLPFD